MLALKYLLMLVAVLSIAATLIMSGYHFWLIFQFRRNLARGPEGAAAPFALGLSRLEPGPVRWRLFLGMMAVGCVSLLMANSITVVPSGMGSVRISQTRGTLPGTLYSGVHFVAPLVEQLKHSPDGRAYVYPIVVKDSVPALLYAWDEPQRPVQGPALELAVQVAAAQWIGLLPPPVVDLVSIAPLAPVKAASAWESLPSGEQQIHLRAQRFARVQAAQMRLHEGPAVLAGRLRRNLYETLRGPIDAAREQFRQDFFARCSSMVDYLDLELVRTLANDDAELLGTNYPGPMV